MADRAVRFDFLGRDVSASRVGERVAHNYEGLGSKLGRVGKIVGLALGGVAVGGIALLGKAMVQGAKDAQSYQTLGLKTAAVIKSTGNVAHISVKGIQQLAGRLESLSGVDEELIINSQNVLATFTRVRNEVGKGNDIFDQATLAALNMSSALGQDLQSSTIQLGKALNDPIKGITALQRVGVSFTKQQKDQIKTLVESGRTLEAQKLILAEITTEFGGAAKAAGGGLGGALARLKDAWGDMFRDIMGKALPALTNLTNWIAKVGVPKFGEFITFIQTKVGPAIAGALTSLGDKLPDIDLSSLGRKIVKTVRGWAQPIIDAFTAGMRTGDWSGFGKAIAEGLSRLGGNLVDGVKQLVGNVDWVNLGKQVGKTAFPFAIGFVATLFDGLITAAREHPFDTALFVVSLLGIGKIGGIIAKVLGKIPFLRSFAPLFEGLNKLTAPINAAIGKLTRLFGDGFGEGFSKEFPRAAKLVKGGVETLIVSVYTKVDDAFKAGGRLITGLGRGMGSAIGKILAAGGRAAAAAVRPFAGAGGWLVGKGAEIISGLARGIGSRIGSAAAAVARVGAAVRRAVAGAGSWLFQAGRNIIGGLISGIASRLGDLAGMVSRAAQTIRNFLPFSPAKEGPLSGRGNPFYSGQAIPTLMAQGMDKRTPLLAAAAGRMAGAINPSFRSPAGTDGRTVVLEIHSGGTRMDDLLAEIFLKAIRTRPGFAQTIRGAIG